MPLELEWDAIDPECWHVLALDGQGNAIGTGRLTPQHTIGRMAVLPAWRGHGVGVAADDGARKFVRLFAVTNRHVVIAHLLEEGVSNQTVHRRDEDASAFWCRLLFAAPRVRHLQFADRDTRGFALIDRGVDRIGRALRLHVSLVSSHE